MTASVIIELIDPDLEELMDKFFVNSKQDLANMQDALADADFETLSRLGHTAKGTGYGYGFRGMGDIGRDLESAAKGRDRNACTEQVVRVEHYLDHVEVRFDN